MEFVGPICRDYEVWRYWVLGKRNSVRKWLVDGVYGIMESGDGGHETTMALDGVIKEMCEHHESQEYYKQSQFLFT